MSETTQQQSEVNGKMMAKNKAAAAELLLRAFAQVERTSTITRTEKL